MKNLKKLNRNELKTIEGGYWADDIISLIEQNVPVVIPLIGGGGQALCNVQCTVNGIVQVKFITCGSTC